MVYHYFPQAGGSVSVVANTNYPPQSGTENPSPPLVGNMGYEDGEAMEYQNLIDMDYEGTS